MVFIIVGFSPFLNELVADRAKQIKTTATVNEDPTEKLIKDLKEENEKLKSALSGGKFDPSIFTGSGKENLSPEG